MINKKILFLTKCRNIYGKGCHHHSSQPPFSSGLYNSANFIHQMLLKEGITSKLVDVVDNNDIDREVHQFKPDVVIIEALWVVPEKFDILHKLHPTVKWVIRIHSEIPFLSNEGISINWIKKYHASFNKNNINVSFNSLKTKNDFSNLFSPFDENIIYLPNYYPISHKIKKTNIVDKDENILNVGCFGAIRPMKNHLIQAMAAIKYVSENDLNLNFHINTGRIENGEQVYKNLCSLFDGCSPKFNLICHDWLEHKKFIELIKTMDIGLQVSFSETFNIVAADFVDNEIPIVTSNQIKWISSMFYADPTNIDDLVKKMKWAINFKKLPTIDINKRRLKLFCKHSKEEWLDFLDKI